MAAPEANLYCDHSRCPHHAVIFGFLPGPVKKKVCQDHMSSLVSKKVAIFNIEAFYFLQSVKDGPVYEERKELMHRCIGALTVLDSECEQEWTRAQTLIQSSCESLSAVIQKTYQEVWERSRQEYEEAKYRLEVTRMRLERLVREKDFRMSQQDLSLCESPPAKAAFRLVVGDCRVEVVETILRHFHVLTGHKTRLEATLREQTELGKLDIAHDICTYAREIGHQLGDFELEARQFRDQIESQLLHHLYYKEIESKYLNSGWGKVKTGEYGRAVELFEKGRVMLGRRNLMNSELWLQISNALAEAHFQVEEFVECETACEEVLGTWGKHGYTFELWRAVFFLSVSLYAQEQETRGYEVVEEWTGKLLPDSIFSQCISLYTQAQMLYMLGDNKPEIAKKYEAGLALGQQVIPHTYLTAFCRVYLGLIYNSLSKSKEEEEQYLQAYTTLSGICPVSITACNSLNNLSVVYRRTGRYVSAEEKLEQSFSILSTYFPDTWVFGQCLFLQGLLYEEMHRKEDAIRKLETALPVLQKYSPGMLTGCNEVLQRLNSK